MNSKMTIGKKLTLSFAGLIVMLVALSGTFLSVVGTLKENFDVAVDKTARKITLAGTLDTAESDMLAWERAMMLYTFAKENSGSRVVQTEIWRGIRNRQPLACGDSTAFGG